MTYHADKVSDISGLKEGDVVITPDPIIPGVSVTNRVVNVRDILCVGHFLSLNGEEIELAEEEAKGS
jgi:hypothetical protein